MAPSPMTTTGTGPEFAALAISDRISCRSEGLGFYALAVGHGNQNARNRSSGEHDPVGQWIPLHHPIEGFHPRDHGSDDGVTAIEMGLGGESHEHLASPGVLARQRHSDGPPEVGPRRDL